jgi:hypothetical protein
MMLIPTAIAIKAMKMIIGLPPRLKKSLSKGNAEKS